MNTVFEICYQTWSNCFALGFHVVFFHVFFSFSTSKVPDAYIVALVLYFKWDYECFLHVASKLPYFILCLVPTWYEYYLCKKDKSRHFIFYFMWTKASLKLDLPPSHSAMRWRWLNACIRVHLCFKKLSLTRRGDYSRSSQIIISNSTPKSVHEYLSL